MTDTYGQQICIPGLVVNANLSTKQYHFVKLASTADTVLAVAATTDVIIGVLQDGPDASGETASVATLGVTVLVAGTSTITAGVLLSPKADGSAITGGAITYAKSLEAVTAIGDEFTAVLGVN